jgi:uncharacterized protein DUF3616
VESHALVPVILAHPDLRDHAARDLSDNGLTIEGLAVAGSQAFIGFRGPLLDGEDRAAVLEVGIASLFGGPAEGGKLHRLNLGHGRGVRDLARLGDDLLILTGPSDDVEGTYSVYRWHPADDTVARLGDVPCDDQPGKPESLLPLASEGGSLSLLLLNDGPNQGDPRVCRMPLP